MVPVDDSMKHSRAEMNIATKTICSITKKVLAPSLTEEPNCSGKRGSLKKNRTTRRNPTHICVELRDGVVYIYLLTLALELLNSSLCDSLRSSFSPPVLPLEVPLLDEEAGDNAVLARQRRERGDEGANLEDDLPPHDPPCKVRVDDDHVHLGKQGRQTRGVVGVAGGKPLQVVQGDCDVVPIVRDRSRICREQRNGRGEKVVVLKL